jgi:hypothetical protein
LPAWRSLKPAGTRPAGVNLRYFEDFSDLVGGIACVAVPQARGHLARGCQPEGVKQRPG